MRLIDVEQAYCADCEYRDRCETIICDLKSIPTIDAVPVVRCKDCKHGKYLRGALTDAYTCSLGWGLSGIVAEKDFCSYGERKDGEG